jgi:hypothetical protein
MDDEHQAGEGYLLKGAQVRIEPLEGRGIAAEFFLQL